MQGTWAHRRRVTACVLCVLIFIFAVVIDQLAKVYISRLKESGAWEDVVIIKGFFYITHTTNSGAAWSFLAGQPWAQDFFKIITIIALVAFLVLFIWATKKDKRFLRVCLVLLSAGAVGNFIDRLLYGYVVDFIGFIFGEYRFPVFNIADALMTVGIALLLIDLLFVDSDALFKKKKTENGEK